ncbi:MAG: formylglycine-generating enzyme family protein [Pirellulales bacterium]
MAALNPNDEYWKTMSLSSAPAHKVRLTQAYYLGTYEVTQEQYEKVAGVNPSHFSATGEGQELVKDEDPRQHPVEMVSFIHAAEFCIKLSKQEQLKPVYFSANNVITLLPGDGYRLPTEAEWEWACRAGTTTSWFHGEQESALGTVAWFQR